MKDCDVGLHDPNHNARWSHELCDNATPSIVLHQQHLLKLLSYAGPNDASASSCSKELTEWNKVNFQMAGVTLAAQIDVSSATAAQQAQLQEAGLDTAALQKVPCSLQVALLPFGDKDEPMLYQGQLIMLLTCCTHTHTLGVSPWALCLLCSGLYHGSHSDALLYEGQL